MISKFGTKMHLSTVQIPTNFGIDWNWSSNRFSISNPDQIELFMYIFGILEWGQLVWKLGELKEFRGSEPIQRTSIGTAPWHRLFHSVNVSWWDHIECATGRRTFGLWVVMGLGVSLWTSNGKKGSVKWRCEHAQSRGFLGNFVNLHSATS